MTKEEAIKTLQELWRETNDSWYEETYKIAIEALKQPPNATQLLDDGTLKVKVADVLDIKRVMVMDNNIIYDAYYPDRPQGEWLEVEDCIGDVHYKCDQCGVEWTFPCGTPKDNTANFCPNCGADMRGNTE